MKWRNRSTENPNGPRVTISSLLADVEEDGEWEMANLAKVLRQYGLALGIDLDTEILD